MLALLGYGKNGWHLLKYFFLLYIYVAVGMNLHIHV